MTFGKRRLANWLYSAKWKASSWRRTAYEKFGDARYSMPAFDDLDKKLQQYLPSCGVFVEAGALDGLTFSNTYYLEKIKGWRGVLIEPGPREYPSCVKQRPGSKVFRCALVAADYPGKTVSMTYGADLSWVNGSYEGPVLCERLRFMKKYREPVTIEVPARTLTSVLDEAAYTEIDFFSLDVEGYELNVLKGLDLVRYRPKVLLIECQSEQAKCAVESYLRDHYRLEALLSAHDYLFLRK